MGKQAGVFIFFVGFTLALIPSLACAQAAPSTTPAPSPAPAPSSSSAPSATAAAPSDPCTTTLAVVTRPSVTTSACVVKAGHVVVESGYQNTIADGGAAVAQYPQALIRAGTRIPNLEVSVTPPTLNRSAGVSGSSDSAFGAKYEIGYSAKWIYAVNTFITVPTGSNGYSGNGTGYTANVDISYALTPALSLAGTLGYNNLPAPSQRYTSIIPSLVLSSMLSSNTALFGEFATFSRALGPNSATRVQYLAGFQQSFANKFQIDLEAGRSATLATGKYRYVGAGVSYYF